MILLSSIVKARQLVDFPPKPAVIGKPAAGPADTGAAADIIKSEPGIGRAEIEMAAVSEANEKKELIIRQALKRAKHIESEARERADALVENALKSSREIMKDAEKKGYEEGYFRGLVDGAQASEAAAEEGLLELSRLIELFKTDQKAALARDEKDLMEIAFELAGKIMKQHAKADEDAVHRMLEEILLENEENCKIYFSEYQKTLDIHIDKAMARKMRDLTNNARLVLIKEEDLIMCETEGGIVDMSVPVQLEQLKKAVDSAY